MNKILTIFLVSFIGIFFPAHAENPNTIVFKYKDGTKQAIATKWKSVIKLDLENISLKAGNETILLPLNEIEEYNFIYNPADVTEVSADSDITIRRDGDLLKVRSASQDIRVSITDISGILIARASASTSKDAVIDMAKFDNNILLITVNGKTFKITRR